jgi:integrase
MTHQITFSELAELYIEKRQRPVGTSDRYNVRRSMTLLYECFPNVDIATFDGDALEEYQRFLIGRNYDRKYINGKLVGFIKTLYRWGVRKKLVDKALTAEILSVPSLQYSERIKENPDRKAAKPEDIEAVLPHVPEQIADMIVLQTLTGLRPSELCNMKAGEICTDANLFGENEPVFKPVHHKTKWKGKDRAVPLGDVEMAIIRKYLPGTGEQGYLFCNLTRFRDKPINERVFSHFIANAIKAHGLNKFTPYQVRHTNATWVSKMLDRDHARAQMGHTTEAMTQKYDHADGYKKKAVLQKRKTAGYVLRTEVIARHVGGTPSSRSILCRLTLVFALVFGIVIEVLKRPFSW